MELLNMPPRLLVFDMDGTFMDSQIFHAKTFHRFINRYIAPIDFETTRRKMGNTVRYILTEAGVPPEEMTAVYAQLTEFCEHDIDDLIAEVGVIDGIRDALVNARARGLRCIVLTNSMETVAKNADLSRPVDSVRQCFRRLRTIRLIAVTLSLKAADFARQTPSASATRNSTLKWRIPSAPEAVLRKLTIHGIAVKRTSWNI